MQQEKMLEFMSQSEKDWLKFLKDTHKINPANFAAPVRATTVTNV